MLTPKQLFAPKYESARSLEVPVLCCSKSVPGHEFHSAFSTALHPWFTSRFFLAASMHCMYVLARSEHCNVCSRFSL